MESVIMRKWWWAWNYEKIESWLEEKAMDGYMLTKVTGFGEKFHFIKASPKKVRFCVDYQDKLTPEYIQLLKDDGWSYCKIPGSWIACWKEYDDIRPELFNDYDTIIDRNNKIILAVTCFFFPTIFLAKLIADDRLPVGVFLVPIVISIFAAIVFYAFSIASLANANTVLKKKKKLQDK